MRLSEVINSRVVFIVVSVLSISLAVYSFVPKIVIRIT
jgi:hypothetical protein